VIDKIKIFISAFFFTCLLYTKNKCQEVISFIFEIQHWPFQCPGPPTGSFDKHSFIEILDKIPRLGSKGVLFKALMRHVV